MTRLLIEDRRIVFRFPAG